MTAESKSLVERLRAPAYWMSGSSEGHEGDNTAPLEAADQIERLEREKEETVDILRRNGFTECDAPACNCGSWHQTSGWPVRFREMCDALEEAGISLNGVTALDALKTALAELARLKSPMEGAKVSAEERDVIRLKYGSYAFVPSEGRVVTFGDLLDDLDHATAQARSAADVENELSRVVLGWREHDYPAQFDRWTAQYIAGRYHDARNTIRTRRKGESNG